MKKAIKLTLAVALMLSASSLFAQKFGRINSQEILLAMPETKEMETNMQAYGKDLQDNLETITVEFNQKYLDFQKNFDTYSDAVKQLKQKELQELQNRREEFEQVAQQKTAGAADAHHREGQGRHRQGHQRERLSGCLRDRLAGFVR